MSTLENEGFPAFLRSRLLRGTQIRAYHVSTPAKACPPLFAPARERSGLDTTLQSHFLAISEARREPTDTTEHAADVLVLAIEVLIFTSTDLTTIFVSKADSTGLLQKSDTVGSRRSSLAQSVITAFLKFLLASQHHSSRLVLSLFARSQNQYLFPGSIENATKHVLDDRQLIKWWCRVLDPLVRQQDSHRASSVKAHIVVPGCDRAETKAFFPPSARSDPASDPKWVNAYPVTLLLKNTSLPPRCLVPRLPDDPKARFLDDLDAQCDENGSWRGIKTLDQFWEMMSYRQECSAGRLVGFLWVVFTPQITSSAANGAVNDEIFMLPEELGKLKDQRKQPAQSKPAAVTPSAPNLADQVLQSRVGLDPSSSIDLGVHQMSSVAGASDKRTKAASTVEEIIDKVTKDSRHTKPSDVMTIETLDSAKNPTTNPSIPASIEKIVLSAEDYQTLMDELLQLDFAGGEFARASSRKWCEKAMQLAGVSTFGVDIHGESTVPVASTILNPDAEPAVNMITGVRKKRKTSSSDAVISASVTEQPTVYTLASNLIRKKVKH